MQWIGRFASSPSGWIGLMSYWFLSFFDASPLEVFSDPFRFDPAIMPPFYAALLKAWRALGGSGSPSGLVVASSAAHPVSVGSITCKLCYQLLLSMNPCHPHCVAKFSPAFPNLDLLVFAAFSSDHLFFSCPLAQSGIACIQSLLFQASPLAPSIELPHMLFSFSRDELC